MIAKLLIANRGEIACRVIRTARTMGIATVAVHSDADRDALHVRQADEAVAIGGAAPSQSYLNVDAILDAARRTGADAVHPGYGFLSENAGFAEACAAAGLVFVGPSAAAIRAMGDKAGAKALMRQAGVPVVPGYDGGDQTIEAMAREAERIGYPLLVKAAAGGGGRGMRRVDHADELEEAVAGARREAENAFGDGTLLLERLVEDARHIEIQIFADCHDNIIHLGERDCSAQRRHQKIVEEAPSPFVDTTLRAAMGEAAVAAARAVGYVGAGTVEFIVGADRSFHFIEMNTRLQVEHPVTEMVTGLDLVEWQLRVAAGEPLPFRQEDVVLSGHAIEARLCAEDVFAGFAPQAGPVLRWRPAMDLPGVRIDHGLVGGGAVSPHYDPMVAKVIAHGATRDEARRRLTVALSATRLLGVTTNRDFVVRLLDHEAFREGAVTTGMIDAWVASGRLSDLDALVTEKDFAVAAAILAHAGGQDWFSSAGTRLCPIALDARDDKRSCVAHFERGALAGVTVGGNAVAVTDVRLTASQASYRVDGVEKRCAFAVDGRALWLDLEGRLLRFEEPDPLAGRREEGGDLVVRSPVTGLLRQVAVAEGMTVCSGDVVAVVEAMKMETALAARADGTVLRLLVRAGDQVRAGDIVVEIAPSN